MVGPCFKLAVQPILLHRFPNPNLTDYCGLEMTAKFQQFTQPVSLHFTSSISGSNFIV